MSPSVPPPEDAEPIEQIDWAPPDVDPFQISHPTPRQRDRGWVLSLLAALLLHGIAVGQLIWFFHAPPAIQMRTTTKAGGQIEASILSARNILPVLRALPPAPPVPPTPQDRPVWQTPMDVDPWTIIPANQALPPEPSASVRIGPIQDDSAANPHILAKPPLASGDPGLLSPSPRRGNIPPQYPQEALRQHQQGTAMLRLKIGMDGAVERAILDQSSGFGLLDQCALDAVTRWRFQPALKFGEPIATEIILPIRFLLRGEG